VINNCDNILPSLKRRFFTTPLAPVLARPFRGPFRGPFQGCFQAALAGRFFFGTELLVTAGFGASLGGLGGLFSLGGIVAR
jgi:hypothetical protein